MSQKLGAIFIAAALGPVSYAGRCIMSRRVKDGLAELSPDNLLGGVQRGIETVAAATSLPKSYIERLLPMDQLHALAASIADRQREAVTQWDIHTGHIGGLLEGVADLTVDGRAPDTALCVLRLSRKMQLDKALAEPLRELSEDLEQWRHLVETCRMVIDDGASLRNAYMQKRILRWGLSVTAVLGVAAAVIWFVRVNNARERLDALIAGDDPCMVATADDSDLAKATDEQLTAIAGRQDACQEQRERAKAAEEEKKRQQAQRAEEEAEKKAAVERCEALVAALKDGGVDLAALPAAKGHEALLERIAAGAITADDLRAEVSLPCPDQDLAVVAAPSFARYAIGNPGQWITTTVLHPTAEKLVVLGKGSVGQLELSIFTNSVRGLIEKTVLMGGDEPIERALRLCSLLDGLGAPAKTPCDALKKASEGG